MKPAFNINLILKKESRIRLRKLLLYGLCFVIFNTFELSCRAKSCPAYGDDTPQKGGLFKKKKTKTKTGLFTKKQGRF